VSVWKSILQEPLLHFVALGGLVFLADHSLRAERDDPRVIVVGPEVLTQSRELFQKAQGREPTDKELAILRERWVDNEVLYREGLALRLDQGDPTLRERVIFKALNVIESNLKLPVGDEATLEAWFEQHRSQYDEPPRSDFLEAVITGKDRSRAAAEAFAQLLNEGREGETKSGLRVFKQRPRSTIVDSFGADFARALDEAPLARWRVLDSKEGPRVVRVEAREPGRPAEFEEIRTQVRQDWEDQKAQELRTSAVRELGKKYQVRNGRS
jgi:hypothetical protein